MGGGLDAVAPIAGAVLGSVLLPGVGTALGASIGSGTGAALGAGLTSGGLNYSKTHNIGSALKSGALSGAGSYIGGNLGSAYGPNLGSVGGALDSSLGVLPGASSAGVSQLFGRGAGSLLSTPISGALGSYAGNQVASGFAPQGMGKQAGNYPFVPQQAAASVAPKGISDLASLTPQQQASGLATQGMYGGGLGADSQAYFGNLINRQLVDPSGTVSPLSSLLPIELSYLDKLGFGGQQDSTSLLKALASWKPGQQSA